MSIIQSIFSTIGNVGGAFFEETEVSRYIVVAETLSGITIPDPGFGNSVTFQDIHAPGLVNGSFPILFFTTRQAGRVDFTVRINNTHLIKRYVLEDRDVRTWHKFIPPDALKTTNNQLILTVQLPDSDNETVGSVTFADVFILYKSNELTIRRPRVLSQN